MTAALFLCTLQNQKEAHTIIALCEILGSDGITLFPDRSNRQRNHCDLQTNESESLGERLIWPCVPDLWLVGVITLKHYYQKARFQSFIVCSND